MIDVFWILLSQVDCYPEKFRNCKFQLFILKMLSEKKIFWLIKFRKVVLGVYCPPPPTSPPNSLGGGAWLPRPPPYLQERPNWIRIRGITLVLWC